MTLLVLRIYEQPVITLIFGIFYLLILLSLPIFFLIKIIRKRRNPLLSYLRESRLISQEICNWVKANIKDGVPVSKLYGPEFVALIEKDQRLYEEIIKIDPGYKDKFIPPKELHKHFVELAQGKHKTSH